MSTLLQDIKYALRVLVKSRGFTAVAVLTLALGIGANTAIFSFVDAWIIKPLPYPQADRLMVFQAHEKKRGWTSSGVTSTADYLDFQRQQTAFAETTAWNSSDFNVTGNGTPALIEGARVSWNFFDTFGAKPLLGRTFREGEDALGASHVAVISEGLWKSRYAQDPKIIGRSITISNESYAIIGVMPGKFLFPLLGISNLWTPLALTDQQRADRYNSFFAAFGRLKPGVTQEQAAAATTAIFSRLEKLYPKTNTNMTMLLSPMTKEIGDNEGVPEVMICLWVVALILLIACANVANLMLSRAAGRTKEMAVRGAIGATRFRLIRQLLTESLLLFFFGGIAGTLFGMWGLSWIETQIPGKIRGYIQNYGYVNLDWTILGFTFAIALVCGLIFGLAPALQNSGVDVNRALKESSVQSSRGGRGARMRKIFVASEIALAVVVLISTTLLVKSFIISVRSNPGYNPANLLTAQLVLSKNKYPDDAHLRNFTDDALARIQALPGVISAGAASSIPYGGFGASVEVNAPDKPAPRPGETYGARFTAASPGYFCAMQMRLIEGRFFTTADGLGSTPVALINQQLARLFWPNENPVGRKIEYGEKHNIATVAGVVNNVKMYSPRQSPERQMYIPLAQTPSNTLAFVAHTVGDPAAIGKAIREAIWAVDADQPISSIEPMETLMVVQDSGNRVLSKLMVFFAVLALFLGAIGIYGVMAHTVEQRTHEIGIRMALGAAPGQVMRSVIVQGLKLTLAGIAGGIAVALATTSMLASELYQVTARDPLTFFGVPIAFAVVAVAACYIPARRAMRVDPMVALRYE